MRLSSDPSSSPRLPARHQAVLVALSQAVHERGDLNQLLDDVSVDLVDTMNVDYASIFETQAREKSALVRGRAGWSEDHIQHDTVSVTPDSLVEYTVRVRDPVTVDDIRTDDRFTANSLPASAEIGSTLTVTIPTAGEPWGVLGTFATAAKSFSEDDAVFLRTVANILGTAIEAREAERSTDHRDVVSDRVGETSPVGIVTVDDGGAIRYVNDHAETLLGNSRSQLIDRPIDDFHWDVTAIEEGAGSIDERSTGRGSHSRGASSEGSGVKSPFSRIVTTGEERFDAIMCLDRPNDQGLWLTVNGIPLEDNPSNGAIFTLRDVTHHRRIETEFEEILGRVSDAFYAVDDDFRFVHVNDRAAELLQHSAEELLGTNLWEQFPEAAEIDEVWEAFHTAMETQTPQSYELYYDPLDFWVEARLYPSVSGISVYFRDVTDRIEREREVRAERDLIERIVETSPVGIVTVDRQGSFKRVNDRARAIVGYGVDAFDSIQEALDALDTVTIDGQPYPVDDHPVHRVLFRGETVHDVEIGITRRNGERAWVSVSGTPLRIDGSISGAVITFIDITERRNAERALRERERQLSTVMNNVPGMIYRCENERGWPMQYVSEGCVELTGYESDALVREDVLYGRDIIVDTDRDRLWEEVQTAVSDRQSFNVTYQIETADDERRWVRETGRGIVDGDGTPDALEGVIIDVTEWKEYERQLEQYRAVTKAASDVIVTIDETDTIQSVSPAVADVFGYEPETIEGESITILMPESTGKRHERALSRYLETDERTLDWDYVEFTGEHADGTEIPVALSFSEITYEGQRYFTGIVRDISERKDVERTLERQRNELARLNRMNELVQDIIRGFVEEPSRTEIEQMVCDRLAASDFYEAAWIVEQPMTDAPIERAAWAGIDRDALGAITDDRSGDAVSREFIRRTLETREMHVVQDISSDGTDDACQEQLRSNNIESVIAVPIHYRDTGYGVLVVASDSPGTFTRHHRITLEKFGETLGFAITAAERKAALLTDTVVELDIRVRDPDHFLFAVTDVVNTELTIEGLIPRSNGAYLAYVTATDVSAETILDRADRTTAVEHSRIVGAEDDHVLLEFGFAEPTVLEEFSEYGATVTNATASNGTGTITVEAPQRVDVRRVVDTFRSRFPDSEVIAKRTHDRPVETNRSVRNTILDSLTNKQFETLESVYYAGYLERPRNSSGDDLAEALDISPSTFHQHRRAGLRNLLSVVLDERESH